MTPTHIDRAMTPPTKCTGEGCCIREHCWRFVAPPVRACQSYMAPPDGKGTLMCDGYWQIRKHDWLVMTGRKKGEHL